MEKSYLFYALLWFEEEKVGFTGTPKKLLKAKKGLLKLDLVRRR